MFSDGIRVAVLAVVSLVCVTGPVTPQSAKVTASFSATTTGLASGSREGIRLDVMRWSTDEEAQKLVSAFKASGSEHWSEALQAAPTVGYVWADHSSLGYAVRYARRSAMPSGAARVVLVTERTLGSWALPAWKAAGPASSTYPFSVIELQLNQKNVGQGKVSLAAKVAVDAAGESIILEDYSAAPVLLANVKQTSVAEPSK
jgi:hypothetical protein